MNNDFYWIDVDETIANKIPFDFPPEVISVPDKDIIKPTLEFWSCWGFIGSTMVTPIRTIVDEGFNAGNADIKIPGFMLTTNYNLLMDLCSAGKIKFFDASQYSRTLYTVSLEQQGEVASYLIGNDNYVKYNFKLKIC